MCRLYNKSNLQLCIKYTLEYTLCNSKWNRQRRIHLDTLPNNYLNRRKNHQHTNLYPNSLKQKSHILCILSCMPDIYCQCWNPQIGRQDKNLCQWHKCLIQYLCSKLWVLREWHNFDNSLVQIQCKWHNRQYTKYINYC